MDKKAQWGLVSAAWFLALSVAGLGYLALQRSSQPVSETQGAAEGSAPKEATCPVTKRHLQVDATTPKFTYKDRDFYFADDTDEKGRSAKQRFVMDPEYYLTGIATFPSSVSISATAKLSPVPSAAPSPDPDSWLNAPQRPAPKSPVPSPDTKP